MKIHSENKNAARRDTEGTISESVLERARAKLGRATGMTDLVVMVKAFEAYDGPEMSGDFERT